MWTAPWEESVPFLPHNVEIPRVLLLPTNVINPLIELVKLFMYVVWVIGTRLRLDAGSVRETLVRLRTMHPALGVRLIVDGESGWVRQTLEPAVGAVEPECHVVAQSR